MKMNTGYALDTKQLHWDKARMTLSEEASTCGFTRFYQLYDDAIDEGVWVKSHKTGKLEAFSFVGVKQCEDGDVTEWQFALTRYGQPTVHLVIFND